MTTNPGEPEVLATIETHAVAAQPIEVIRHPDGSIDARAGAAYWCDNNPFSAPGGELWNVDTEEWGSHDDVPAWAGADVPDGVVIDVAVGDFPELPAPVSHRCEVHPSGIVVAIRRSIEELVAGDDHVLPLTPLAGHYAYITRTAAGGSEVTSFAYIRAVHLDRRQFIVSPAIDAEGGVEHHFEQVPVPFDTVVKVEVVR